MAISCGDIVYLSARAMSTDGHRVAATAYKQANRTPRPTTSGPATSTTETEGPARNIRCACDRKTPKFGRVRGKVRDFKTCLEC